jgi:predicted PhzF superfamily epimerase YddE/YHI9
MSKQQSFGITSSTKTLRFTTLDVFTKTSYEGNPLAIVQLNDDSSVSQAQKQKIAKEFNLSETVFLYPENAQDPTERRIDIFTTTEELNFAGHPTIGTANFLLRRLSAVNETKLSLITKAGRILVEPSASVGARAQIPHAIHVHNARVSLRDLSIVYPETPVESFSGGSGKETMFPVVSCVKGMTFVLVGVPDISTLGKFEIPAKRPNVELDQEWNEGLVGVYFYTLDKASVNGPTKNIRARLLLPREEDPATGSAASALCAFLAPQLPNNEKMTEFEITQGVEMGQESHIFIETELDDKNELKNLWLSGDAVVVMDGRVKIPNV